MLSYDLFLATPELILCGAALLLLMVGAFAGRERAVVVLWLSVLAMVAAAAAILFTERNAGGAFNNLFIVDRFGDFMKLLVLLGAGLTTILSLHFIQREEMVRFEFPVLLLFATLGMLLMISANNLISLYMGLELQSLSLYVVAAFRRDSLRSSEAGLKYFVLGGFSSAFLLYGIAFVYGATGSTNLVRINAFLADNVPTDNGLLLLGFGFMLVGLGFKVAAVPFHSWTPDVYQGSPTPVVAFMASGIKAAGFAGLIRVFVLTFGTYRLDWQPIVYVLAVLSLFVGAVVAIVQSDVKRMLAYSSISHAGFILVGVEVATDDGIAAVLFYLAAYTFMVAGSFGVVALVARRGDNRTSLDDYRGLARTNPQLAFFFTVFLLAQAGVPFTVGFFAKFYVISAAADAESFALALIAMVSAVIAAFLYLRIIVAMYMSDPVGDDQERIEVPFGAGLAIGLCFAVTLFFGIFPGLAFDWATYGVPELVEYQIPDVPVATDGIPVEGFGE
jgi:NADH-quinone oxidoreductase subunit N